MSRGITNNNPGNIRYSKSNNWLNQTGQDSDGFTQFKTADDGLRAMYKLVNNYQGKGLNTVQDIISRYAPTSENDTASYIKNVSQKMGVDPNKQLQTSDLNSLVSAMVFHENGSQPYNPEQYSNAQAMSQSSIDNNQQTFSNQFNTGAVPAVPSTTGTNDMNNGTYSNNENGYARQANNKTNNRTINGAFTNDEAGFARQAAQYANNPSQPIKWPENNAAREAREKRETQLYAALNSNNTAVNSNTQNKSMFNRKPGDNYNLTSIAKDAYGLFKNINTGQVPDQTLPDQTLPDVNNLQQLMINNQANQANQIGATTQPVVQPGALTNMREINQSLSGMNTNGQDLNPMAAIQGANFGGLGANGGMPEGGFLDIKAMADPANFDATAGITALNGVGASLNNKITNANAFDTGMFSQNSMFGGVDKDGVKTNGWLTSGTKAFADIAGAYASIEGLGLAKDTFKFNKALITTDLNNRVQTVNNRIGDQAAARRSAYTSSAFDQSVADKAVAKKGVKGLGG